VVVPLLYEPQVPGLPDRTATMFSNHKECSVTETIQEIEEQIRGGALVVLAGSHDTPTSTTSRRGKETWKTWRISMMWV
jgi:hypothetical protein